MIQGILGLSSNKAKTVIAMSCDSSNSTKLESDKLICNFSEQRGDGYQIGYGKNNRTVFFSHFSCTGCTCPCRDISQEFLLNECLSVDQLKLKSYWNSDLHSPFLAIFIDYSRTLFISSYSKDDFIAEEKSPGIYFIRDCFIYDDNSDTTKIKNNLFSLLEEENTDKIVEIEINKFFENVTQAEADHISLIQNEQVTSLKMKPFSIFRKRLKPKGKINAYNFYSKEYHKQAKLNNLDQDSYNERNVKIAEKWAKMAEKEKFPFVELANADKIRYYQELQDPKYAAINCSKNISAYNVFANQENQFLTQVGCNGIMGQHCGKRWKEMEEKEKRIYLELVDSLNYGSPSKIYSSCS